MKIHLIAIGGSVMHNIAIALHQKGYEVSGSDDALYEPAAGRLKELGLFPKKLGWDEHSISEDLDVVIAGMHAKADNPELNKALEMGIQIMSFPQFLYHHSRDKLRVVIAGSHGKTSVTAMVMHILKKVNMDFDYAAGAAIEGFENSVRLSDTAPIMIIEGDEYLSSAIDRRSKFLWYHPQITFINSIAWDHINVFPTYEDYYHAFRLLIQDMKPESVLIYNNHDREVMELVKKEAKHLKRIPASLPLYKIVNGKTIVIIDEIEYPITVFGEHNLQNLSGAQKICAQLGISKKDFWTLSADFKGAGKRLERIENNKGLTIFRDFAHAPSKVKGSMKAVAMQYPDLRLIVFLELHTYSSLRKDFLPHYFHSLNDAAKAFVFIDKEAAHAKSAGSLSEDEIRVAFGNRDITLIQDKENLTTTIQQYLSSENVLLLMSSGNAFSSMINE